MSKKLQPLSGGENFRKVNICISLACYQRIAYEVLKGKEQHQYGSNLSGVIERAVMAYYPRSPFEENTGSTKIKPSPPKTRRTERVQPEVEAPRRSSAGTTGW